MPNEAKIKEFRIAKTKYVNFELPEGNLQDVLEAIEKGTQGFDKKMFSFKVDTDYESNYGYANVVGNIPKTDEELDMEIEQRENIKKEIAKQQYQNRKNREKAEKALYTKLHKKYGAKK